MEQGKNGKKEMLKHKTVAAESQPILRDLWSWDGPLVLSQIDTREPGFLFPYLPDTGFCLCPERVLSVGEEVPYAMCISYDVKSCKPSSVSIPSSCRMDVLALSMNLNI